MAVGLGQGNSDSDLSGWGLKALTGSSPRTRPLWPSLPPKKQTNKTKNKTKKHTHTHTKNTHTHTTRTRRWIWWVSPEQVHNGSTKLPALVYDILPPATAVIGYPTGLRKLLANRHFFAGAQTAVSLEKMARIASAISFRTVHTAYAITNETKIIWIDLEQIFCLGRHSSCLCACLDAMLLPQSY